MRVIRIELSKYVFDAKVVLYLCMVIDSQIALLLGYISILLSACFGFFCVYCLYTLGASPFFGVSLYMALLAIKKKKKKRKKRR